MKENDFVKTSKSEERQGQHWVPRKLVWNKRWERFRDKNTLGSGGA